MAVDVHALFERIEAMPEAEREAHHEAVRAEIARRRNAWRVQALEGLHDVAALIDLAGLLGDAAGDDAGRRELLWATADRARAAAIAIREALGEPAE
ncbi:hypothetical protein [Rubrimonas cliftonensis]|uniref:Uncharacterized protein n=1 Tax=Rubrimonas cliftonensis TaxID=89524 RepID=A0A1H4GE47_9RHOB|nr:hypothetical protein [Rubrimonas cliftonensis]SEB06982.1 hypothetical protein SAMN05444370_1502 [Rubrimonas cliftonensis]